jgi:hypothetical protein
MWFWVYSCGVTIERTWLALLGPDATPAQLHKARACGCLSCILLSILQLQSVFFLQIVLISLLLLLLLLLQEMRGDASYEGDMAAPEEGAVPASYCEPTPP